MTFSDHKEIIMCVSHRQGDCNNGSRLPKPYYVEARTRHFFQDTPLGIHTNPRPHALPTPDTPHLFPGLKVLGVAREAINEEIGLATGLHGVVQETHGHLGRHNFTLLDKHVDHLTELRAAAYADRASLVIDSCLAGRAANMI